MRLPRIAIENHQFTTVVVLLLLIVGIASFLTMPRSEDPQFKLPISFAIAIYPGATPGDIERLVIDPIEEALNELEDIKRMESTVKDGLALVEIEFDIGVDPDEKYDEFSEKINSIRPDLPDGVIELTANLATPLQVQILQFALISDNASYRDLETQADVLKRRLERVPGVREVENLAFPEQEVRVSLDMEKCSQLGISLNMVMGIIQSENANIPAGSVDIGTRKFNVETSGDYETLEDIANTILSARDGRIVYLKDVARLEFDYEDETYHARVNGDRAIFVAVEQKAGTNIFDVVSAAKETVREFRDELPPNMKIDVVFDQSESVSARLNSFFSSLAQGVLLVGLIVVLSLGLRASLIVMLVIPMSIMVAVGFVDLSDFALQQMTIVGMVIALGLLVDNAIVVTENVSRFMRIGHRPKEAAIQGTGQIAWPIVSSTLTTVMAFVPLVALQSTSGSFIRSMPITVIYILLASLLISLTLTPYLSSRFLRPHREEKRPFLQRYLDGVTQGRYRRALNYALKYPARVLIITFAALIGSLVFLMPLVGVSLFPKAEKPQFLVNIDTPEGTSLEKTNAVARDVEAVLAQHSGVKRYTTNVGRGNPQIYYNVAPAAEKSTHAQIFVVLEDAAHSEMPALIADLRAKLGNYPGAQIIVQEFEQGPPVDAPISFKVIGEDLDVLQELAIKLENIIEETPGTTEIVNPLRTSKTNLHVDIHRAKASMMGVRTVDIDRTVRAAIAGLPVSTFKDSDGKEYNIVVRLPMADAPSIEDFDRIYVGSVTGAQVPLKNLADIRFKLSPPLINHYNMERTVIVNANVEPGYNVEAVAFDIIERLDAFDWPEGYRYDTGGLLASRQDAFGGMITAILVAIISIFGILVLQFRSYRQPIIVYSAIPVAIIGSILALLLTGYTFSFTAFVGLTSLVGIVINNSIILVDYTNQLRRDGMSIGEAIRKASETRLTPIVLTTATTIGGLLPLTLGGGTMWAPMGWTIIGGLLMSTILTLIVVPVLYMLLTKEEPLPPLQPDAISVGDGQAA